MPVCVFCCFEAMPSIDEPENVICEPTHHTNDEAPTNGTQEFHPRATLRTQPPNLLRSQSQRRSPKGRLICVWLTPPLQPSAFVSAGIKVRLILRVPKFRFVGGRPIASKRYEDLLQAPPPVVMDDLLLVPGVRMLCTSLLVGHCRCTVYRAHRCCLFSWLWYAIGGQHI